MNHFSLPVVLISSLLLTTTSAFLRNDITKHKRRNVKSSISSIMIDDDESSPPVNLRSTVTRTVMSKAIPFLKCPPILAEYSEIPGNAGFDPVGFVKDYDDLLFYQEAEIKHARLAMLAAVGWPLSELWNRELSELWNLPTIAGIDGRVPALLNNNLGTISPIFWGFCLGLSAAIDTFAILKSRDMSDVTYFPGKLGFDPFGLYPSDKIGQLRMRQNEVLNGRLAMIAITGFAFQEFVSKFGVVNQTPLFFQPIPFGTLN